MATSTLEAPPAAPGSLTAPAGPSQVLDYLSALGRWRSDLRAALASLDRRAQVATDPDSYTGDLTLALSMLESIDRRADELEATWDSGRVGPAELAKIAELTWGRLPDALGHPSAFSLSEATTLAAALAARLAARLDADAIAGSGAADRIEPLRETLARCRELAATLGRHGGDADDLAAQLDAALSGGSSPAATGVEVDRIADAAEVLERDLIKETALRSRVEADAARLADRRAGLAADEQDVRAGAERCRAKIAGAPRLAVPDVDALGPVPAIPADRGEPGSWTAARAELDRYRERLDLVAAALEEAGRRFAAPMAERAELRGLLEAYRAKAAAAGLVEDPDLAAAFEAARAVLWSAPCDLAAARPLVDAYQQAVAVRTTPSGPAPPHQWGSSTPGPGAPVREDR